MPLTKGAAMRILRGSTIHLGVTGAPRRQCLLIAFKLFVVHVVDAAYAAFAAAVGGIRFRRRLRHGVDGIRAGRA